MPSAINAETNCNRVKGSRAMIDISFISKARKVILWIAISAVSFFGVIAIVSLVVSWGVLSKPMQYQNVVPDIRLSPGERKVFEFESFCLDHHRGGPRSADSYSLMSTPAIKLRPYLREIFDEYLSHPSRWKQGDVQQAIWYAEGDMKWEALTPEQRMLIKSATGKEDPVSGHPVIFLGRMASAFGVVVKTNLTLALLIFCLVVLTMSSPWTVIERGISWMISPRLLQKIAQSRVGQSINTLAQNKELNRLRIHVDVLFTRLVFRIFSRKG
ncbi:MAG: hypothetical protein JW976_02750 [Syntrophaceae bacterium]|nr:hypothetical protein [Syntrophaceae bacterium]